MPDITMVPIDEWQKTEDRIGDSLMVTGQTEDAFQEAFESAWDGLGSALAAHWSEDDEEFSLMYEYVLEFCRMMAVSIMGKRCFCREFFQVIQSYLKTLPEDWAVYVDAEPEFQEHHLDGALIIVEKEAIHLAQLEDVTAYPALIDVSLADREKRK